MTAEEADKLLELMARAKAVWMVPELLKLAEEASSPTDAYAVVLEHTGKRKKALAARWYAIAQRTFDPFIVGATSRYLRTLKNAPQRLRILLTTPD
jgi:hypothetical protein